MKNETRKQIEALIRWTEETKRVFEKSGETDFGELEKKEKKEILKALEETGLEIIEDGDSDGTSKAVETKDKEILISVELFSDADYYDDFDKKMRSLQLYANEWLGDGDDYKDIMDFAEILKEILSAETKMVNLTPHEITFYAEDGATIVGSVPSSGIARAAQFRKEAGKINGIPVNETKYGEVENLPDPQENTIYIVSVITAQAAKGRGDLYIVDDAVRDDAGRILGCKALAQI